MAQNVKRFRPNPRADESDERRRHFRVLARVNLRGRAPQAANEVPDAERDLINAFEELASASTRYRKELGGPGRAFLDRLMMVVDGVVGQMVTMSDEGSWTNEGVVEANISAGGIGFCSQHQFHVDEIVEIQFTVLCQHSVSPFRTRAHVRRCNVVTAGQYDVGLEFVDIGPLTRERLVRLVFDMQRAELRRYNTP